MFFAVAQSMISEKGTIYTLTGKQQTERFLKAGYDAVEDKAQKAIEATINHFEPEQIIFLTRNSFKVVEVFQLKTDIENKLFDRDSTRTLRKLAALIATKIGDKLQNEFKPKVSWEGNPTYYTKSGRKIEIKVGFERSGDGYDGHIKPHKLHGTDQGEKITINMYTERGNIKKEYEPDKSYEDISSDIAEIFNKSKQQSEFSPYDIQKDHPEVMENYNQWKSIATKYSIQLPQMNYDTQTVLYLLTGNVNQFLHIIWAKRKKQKPDNLFIQIDEFAAKRKFPYINLIKNIIMKLLNDRTMKAETMDSIAKISKTI